MSSLVSLPLGWLSVLYWVGWLSVILGFVVLFLSTFFPPAKAILRLKIGGVSIRGATFAVLIVLGILPLAIGT